MNYEKKHEKDEGLQNILDEEQSRVQHSAMQSHASTKEPNTQEYVNLDDRPLPREDFIDIGLRSGLALLMAVFFSAIVAGMIEANPDWDMEIGFASLTMIGMTAIFYYPIYKTLSWMGVFRRKEEE
jgi:hypothetical protein